MEGSEDILQAKADRIGELMEEKGVSYKDNLINDKFYKDDGIYLFTSPKPHVFPDYAKKIEIMDDIINELIKL